MLREGHDAVPGFEAHRLEQLEQRSPRRQDEGFRQALVVLAGGRGAPRDTATDAVLGAPGLGIQDDRADRDAEARPRARFAGRREVTHRARVDAARRVLELGDRPHRSHLRRPGDRTTREQRAEDLHGPGSVREPGADRGRQLPHGLVALGLEHRRHLDRP